MGRKAYKTAGLFKRKIILSAFVDSLAGWYHLLRPLMTYLYKIKSGAKLIILPLLMLAAMSNLAEADEPRAQVAVERGADGVLVLSGADCPTLERQAAALADWRSRLHESPGSHDLCRCEGAACSLRVSSVAPDFVNLTHGTKAGRWGPNCWNTALVSNKILSASSFTSPEEMTFWMKSPLCRALRQGESPRPGDIIAIRDQAGEEVHGFVYLTEELSFSKNYLTAAAPFALQSPDAVYQEFPVPQECRAPGSSGPGCASRSDYFRCSTIGDYQSSMNPAPDQDYLRAAASVSSAEKSLSELILRWKTDPELRGRAAEILASSKEELLPVRELARTRSGLLWDALVLRIDSLLHQIDLI